MKLSNPPITANTGAEVEMLPTIKLWQIVFEIMKSIVSSSAMFSYLQLSLISKPSVISLFCFIYYMWSQSLPFAFHEHLRKRGLLAWHSREQIMNNIKMYFSANCTWLGEEIPQLTFHA